MKAFIANRDIDHAMVGKVKKDQMVVVEDDYQFLGSVYSEDAFEPLVLTDTLDDDLMAAWEEKREGSSVAILSHSDYFDSHPTKDVLVAGPEDGETDDTADQGAGDQGTDPSTANDSTPPPADLLDVSGLMANLVQPAPPSDPPAAEAVPAAEPTQPVVESAQPAQPVVEPAAQPVTEPAQPVSEPAQPVAASATEPAQPVVPPATEADPKPRASRRGQG